MIRVLLHLGFLGLLGFSSVWAMRSPTAKRPVEESKEMKQNQLVMQKEWSEVFGGPGEAGTKVIRDAESWKNFWSSLGQEPPEADFSRQMAVAVFMGIKPTGGYSISVEKIEDRKGKLTVWVREKHPPKGAFVIQALTSPYFVGLIERSDLPVDFEKLKGDEQED